MPLATESGQASGAAIADCYASLTATAGTELLRVIPPKKNARAKLSSFSYKAGATAHIVTVLTSQDDTTVNTDAAAGQAVVVAAKNLQSDDGSVIAAGDYVIVRHEDGSWGGYKVSSISGLSITLTSNLTKKVLKDAPLYLQGAIADNADRQFTINANESIAFSDAQAGLGTATSGNSPLLVHSANATDAGTLRHVAFFYDSNP